MSCQIQVVAKINDLPSIRKCLFPSDDNRGSDNWLQLCEISVSPVGDLIVIANGRKIVSLTSKWKNPINEFEITQSCSIHDYDKVKAVLALPIVEENQNSNIGPDWTCILVAFDSGYVRFYTENCQLLFEKQFHNENITSVKCQSQHGPKPDISLNLQPEEIYIQYKSNLVVLSGIQLIQHLRRCRNQVLKGDSVDFSEDHITPKKWGFVDQSVIHDAAVVGLNLTGSFDHLLTASISGGFDTKYSTMPPHGTLVLATGSKPFLGYHYALEGVPQPMLTDVAKVVASKLKSALPTWLTGGKSQPEKQTSVALQPADNMGCRFGLCDLRRTANSIYLSQDHRLAAICDALGRVLVVDSFRGIVLKIFKGFRDAQCSFLQVPEEKKSKHKKGNKVAHFLVIYSPKKATLEVFSLQQWTNIVTFSASKYSRLVFINYGLMGFTSTIKSKYICQYSTLLIDNDGSIKEILVPYHFALCEKDNNRIRDIHIYKKLRHYIKSQEFDIEELSTVAYKTCTELQTLEFKSQIVDLLLTNRNIPISVISKCIKYFVDNLNDDESVPLKSLCENVYSLLNFFSFIIDSVKNDTSNKENGNLEQTKNLHIDYQPKEMNNLQKLLDISNLNDNKTLPKVHVSFSNNEEFLVTDFLSIFDLNSLELLVLKPNVDDNLIFQSSEFIFKSYIQSALVNFQELEGEILKSRISPTTLFDMLVNYWVNRALNISINLEKEMNNLTKLFYVLAKIAVKNMATENSSLITFWSKVRSVLANSGRPFPALMAAVSCKAVAEKIDSEVQVNDDSTILEDNIEILSQENIEWSILIGKLEDISLLNIVLTKKPHSNDPSLPKLCYQETDISLKYVLEKGKGSVTERVAKWLTSSGINPQYLAISRTEECNKELVNDQLEHCILEQLNLMREHFPYSLESSSLLANMAWEYASAWQKDIGSLENLEAAIKCFNFIQNPRIKQGLFQLLWNTHLKIVIESTCKLINKVGKLPKERLCKQDTGLSDSQITTFLNISCDFMESFMDITAESYRFSKVNIEFENIWDNGSQSLVELAAQQKEVNFDLLHLHYQLTIVLQLIATFSIKHTKPINTLFEASIVNLFFIDLQRKIEVSWNKSDIKLNSSRIQFLFKIIAASLESITVNESGMICSTEHITWTSKCFILGRSWNLDIDILRRYQIIQLYSNGFDSLAQELVSAVSDPNDLGKDLFKIAIRRLSHYLSFSTDLGKAIAAVSPMLTNYMVNLKSNSDEKDDLIAPSSIKALSDLSAHTIYCLSEDEPEYKLALLLLDACDNLGDDS